MHHSIAIGNELRACLETTFLGVAKGEETLMISIFEIPLASPRPLIVEKFAFKIISVAKIDDTGLHLSIRLVVDIAHHSSILISCPHT